MTLRAYMVNPTVPVTSLPWVFDADVTDITYADDTGYVEVYGYLPGGLETVLRQREATSGVPAEVTRFQALAALHKAGLLKAVEQAVTQTDTLVQLAWANAQVFRRTSPTVLSLAQVLGLSPQQLDDLFISAAQIDA